MQHPFVIGVRGGTGSGKSCVSDLLCRRYDASGIAVLNQDSYYVDRSALSVEERRSLNYDHPSAIDHDLLLRHVEKLAKGSAIERPCYCFSTHTRSSETELIHPAAVILVEGIFALWDPRLRSRMNLRIYVDAEPDLRFIRRLRRDIRERGRTVESVVEQYLESVRPMHEAFIEPTKAHANFVVRNSGSMEDLSTLLDRIAADNLKVPSPTPEQRTPRR